MNSHDCVCHCRRIVVRGGGVRPEPPGSFRSERELQACELKKLDLQIFTGTLGGSLPPAVTAGGRGFNVANSDSFTNLGSALGRSCDIQHNACANKANSGGGFSVSQCDAQVSTSRRARGCELMERVAQNSSCNVQANAKRSLLQRRLEVMGEWERVAR